MFQALKHAVDVAGTYGIVLHPNKDSEKMECAQTLML